MTEQQSHLPTYVQALWLDNKFYTSDSFEFLIVYLAINDVIHEITFLRFKITHYNLELSLKI